MPFSRDSGGRNVLMRRRFSAVCFDLDGVLVQTMPLHVRAWQMALRPLGLRVARRLIYEWEGETGAVTAKTLLARQGSVPSRAEIAAVLHQKETFLRRIARRMALDKRLAELLAWLSHRRVPMGLVTGTSSQEVERLVPPDVLEMFSVVMTGDRVRQGKPHPESYRRAFRALGVAPVRTVVVENAPYGIRSAKRAHAGFVLALASSLPAPYLVDAHLIVTSPERLCAVVKQLMVAS